MALNCGIAWTAKQDKQFLFLLFSQKYLIFYLALTVINLLNRSMYKIGRLDVPKKHNRSLSFNGPKLWNSLDSETRQAISLSVFQSKVFNFLSGINCDKLTE